MTTRTSGQASAWAALIILASAFAILLQREGFRVGDKVVVISDILEGVGVEAIHVREVPALAAVAAVADFPDEDQDAP